MEKVVQITQVVVVLVRVTVSTASSALRGNKLTGNSVAVCVSVSIYLFGGRWP